MWGSAFPAIRAALHGYDPITMAVFRFSVASLALVPLVLVRGFRLPRKTDVPLLIIAAFFSIPGYHVCLNIGEKNVTASAASLILSTLPIWAIIWAGIFLKEKFSFGAWVGVTLSFAGAGVIAFGEGGGFQINSYVGFVLLSALCGSIYTTIQKKLIGNYDSINFNCYIIWFGTLMLLPFASGLPAAFRAASAEATWSTVYLGVFPGAITFVLWASVIKRMPASRAVMFLYLIPVVATLIGWLWLKEVPSLLSLAGGALILLGLYVERVGAKRADQGL